MASLKLRPGFRFIIIAPIILISATQLSAQTPDAKTKPTGAISGRVTIGEKPAPGIMVVVSGLNSQMPMAQTTSDADGNYRLGGLAAGQINVTPVAPVYVVPGNAMFGQGRVVNLSMNETVEGIDFKLTRGGVITGRITDGEGRPIIEERVNLLFVDENGAPVRGSTVRPSNFMMNQTDDRGVYRIYGLPAGHYKISAGSDSGGAGLRASGYYPRVYYPDAPEVTKAAIVDVSAGGETKNIDIKLGRPTTTYAVSGRIIDADNGQPLPGVYFSFGAVQQNQNQSYVSGTSGPSSPTNSQGEFRMEGLSPGRYVFILNPANFNPNATSAPKVYSDPVPFEILEGDVTNLEIKAQRGLSISGVVIPEGITDKTVLAKISSVLIDGRVESPPSAINVYMGGVSTRVGADGSFVLDGLSPGKVSFSLGYRGTDFPGFKISRIESGGVTQNRQVDLAPGQSISGLKVYLIYGTGAVRGQLKVEGGTLASDAVIFISLVRPGGSIVSNSQADSRGRFLIRGIPAGTYEVMMQLVSLGSQTPLPRQIPRRQQQSVTISDGIETEVFFTLDLTRKDVP
jgi:protocatechuate 3,4-dioxygenase beta subunit